MTDDRELLRCYSARGPGAQEAFATLVQRHLDLVYSAARRITGSAVDAQDVAQAVFADLAAQARSFPAGAPVVAWLHVVARRTAIDAVRREARRRRREEAAAALASPPPMPASHASWTSIEPLLDEAVAALPPADRAAILLRYFEQKSLRDVGAALGASEDAAQKRVSRALEQLREFFVRRGISVTSAGLTADLLAHATFTAPSALSALATSAGLSATAHLVVMTTLQKSLLGGVAALVLGGAASEGLRLSAVQSELASLRSDVRHVLADETAQRRRRDEARQRLAAASAPPVAAALPAAIAPEDAAMAAEIRAWFARVAHLRQFAARHPERLLPEMKLLTEEDWHSLGDDAAPVDDPAAAEKVLTQLRFKAKNRFGIELRSALNRYLGANDGRLPESVAHLVPYFESPPDPAMLARYEVVRSGRLADVNAGSTRQQTIIMERPTDFDEAHLGVTSVGFTMGPVDLRFHATRAARRYEQATGGPPPSAPSLLPYFDPPLPPRQQERFLEHGARYLTPSTVR